MTTPDDRLAEIRQRWQGVKAATFYNTSRDHAFDDALNDIGDLFQQVESLTAALDAERAASQKREGDAYWRGFHQAEVNKPGALSTAEELVAVHKELAEAQAQLSQLREELVQRDEQLGCEIGERLTAETDLREARAALKVSQQDRNIDPFDRCFHCHSLNGHRYFGTSPGMGWHCNDCGVERWVQIAPPAPEDAR